MTTDPVRKLDGKVYGRLFAEKDHAEIPHDEYVVFRAHDKALLKALRYYRTLCLDLGVRSDQDQALMDLITRVEQWQSAHPERMKIADVHPGEISTSPMAPENLVATSKVLSVILNEPELPGDVPNDVANEWIEKINRCNGDASEIVNVIAEVARRTVRVTKQCIYDNVQAIL